MKIFDAIRAGWRWLLRIKSPSKTMNGNPVPAPLPWAPPATSTQNYLARDYRIPVAPLKAQGGFRHDLTIIDELHEMQPGPLILSKKPDTTIVQLHRDPKRLQLEIRTDDLDAFCYALQRMAMAAGDAAAALINAAHVATDATMINRHATPKDIHYITHGRKARTRKKYRNRVLRRARRAQRKEARP